VSTLEVVIDHDSATPPWRQLAALLRKQIATGVYPPGSRLPSITTLSQEHHLASVTVRKALNALREEGLTTTESGWGTYVKGKQSPQPDG
jgi:DNA-binding GntR family transcriptional regulator